MYCKAIKSGDVVEVYSYEKSPNPSPIRKPRQPSKGFTPYHARREDNLLRLRKAFTRLVRSNLVGTDNPSFFTFTCIENIRLETAYPWLHEYFRTLRRRFGRKFRYIAVPEFQKRGAVHFHALVWGLPQKLLDDELRTRNLQRIWGRGFIDFIATDGSPKLAGYLSKYMLKAMHDKRLLGKKAYVASRNVVRPLQVSVTETLDDLAIAFDTPELSTATPLIHKNFMTQWLGNGRYELYEINKIQNEN